MAAKAPKPALNSSRPKASAANANGPATKTDKARRDNFCRLGEIRSRNAVKAIQRIGNLSNSNDYAFTEADVALIMDAIKLELQATESRFKVAMQRNARRPVKLAA